MNVQLNLGDSFTLLSIDRHLEEKEEERRKKEEEREEEECLPYFLSPIEGRRHNQLNYFYDRKNMEDELNFPRQ